MKINHFVISGILLLPTFCMAVPMIDLANIGTITTTPASITTVTVTACNFHATSWDDCYNTDNNGWPTTVGSLAIVAGNKIKISIPAIAQPLNLWQTFYSYSTPYTSVKLSSSHGPDCYTPVVPYTCSSSTTCSVLSFFPLVICNLN